MTCGSAQQRMSIGLVGELPRLERLEMEAHVGRCRRCADVLADLRATAVALDRAYAPYRATTVALSPARARLAARAPVAAPLAVRVARVTRRFNEVALAAAVTAFAFVGEPSVAPARHVIGDDQPADTTQLTHVTARLDDATFVRWLRLERYVPPEDLVDPTATLPEAPKVHGGEGSGRLS